MNQNQIEQLAMAAGLNANQAKTAAAIAMAESGGNPTKHTVDSDDDSYGLWQINMKGDLGPDRRKQFGLTSNAALLDPATNARVMRVLSDGGSNWKKWGAYTNGSYKKFLVAGGLADILPGGNAVQDGASAVGEGARVLPYEVVDAAKKIGDGLNRTTQWITNQRNWVRILYVVGGSAMVLAGISILAKPAIGALPTGKLAKVASKLAK